MSLCLRAPFHSGAEPLLLANCQPLTVSPRWAAHLMGRVVGMWPECVGFCVKS